MPVDVAEIRFTLNGRPVLVAAPTGERLSETLRERLGARDVKIGCNAGDCGACSVLVEGKLHCACLMPVQKVQGRVVETVAGLLATDARAQRLADSFQDHAAAQCGFCTPGMMVASVALLRETPAPSEAEITQALGGVLCRCTGYRKIIDAVADVPHALGAAGGAGHAGAAIRRVDGAAKVAGAESFGDDVAPPGTLEILVIRAPYPHAAFAFGDLEAWRAERPGLVAVLTAADVPGRNAFGVIPAFIDQPAFAESTARFRGEAVAAVVGTPDAMRALDPSSFPVVWQERTAVQGMAEAQAEGAPLLHQDRPGNLMCRGFVARGDAAAALAAADVTVEGHFFSGFVEHAYLEPEAGFAEVIEGRIEIHACTQAPVMDLESMAILLGHDRTRIRIVPTAVGGGFGAKLDLSVQPYLAIAALKTGRPVRLTYSRTESMQSTTKRHPSDIRLRLGATRDGRLSGCDFRGDFNTGAYASWGPTVANRVPVHASGPYFLPDYRAESRAIHTHNPPSGAFRGFGVPQAAIALESLLDELAIKLDIDPLEFRLRNALDNGVSTVCGQVFAQGVGIKPCLEALAPAWQAERLAAEAFNRSAEGAVRRGVGLASGWYGCGNTSLPNPSTIMAHLMADGRILLHQGAVDIGQGSNTVIAQIFATALGVPVAQVGLIGADTDLTPDAGKTSASRQTFVSGNAARLCGQALRAQILAALQVSDQAELTIAAGHITAQDGPTRRQIALNSLTADAAGRVFTATGHYDPPTRPLDANGQGAPYAQFGYAAQMAVVEVDTTLGTLRILRFVAAHDVGKAINPLLAEGQIQGGVAQGIGMALMEEYIPGRSENLHDYLIPTIGDIPPIESILVEVPDAHGPYGAKGLGEHVLIPTAPALLNAIRHACGARLTHVPVTPATLAAAIKGADHV